MSGIRLKRGAFIAFEGCDRTGKSTQCSKLVERLKSEGIPSQLIQFPDRTTCIGKIINNYLMNKEECSDEAIHLLFTANRWESEKKMKDLLQEGVTLVADRYCFSGLAYSSAKPGMNIDWCRQPESGLPKPDLVFFLQTFSKAIGQRDGFSEERYERSEFQQKVYENFLKLKDDSWEVIDGDRGIDEIHGEVFQLARKAIADAEGQDLKLLW